MKTQDKQIIQKLQAYDPNMVLKAFELYKTNLESSKALIQEDLKKEGWVPQFEKPTVPYYYIDGLYWVMSEKARQQRINQVKKVVKKETNTPKQVSKKKTSMGLQRVELVCPTCGAKMYKQRVCPACKDGKNGFKIRLICEENSDHEVLL